MSQRSRESAALAATKILEGPHIRMPANTADRTGVACSRYPLRSSYAVMHSSAKSQTKRSVGLMDKVSAPGAGDSSFESWADHWWRGRHSGEVGEWPSARMNELRLLPTRPSRDPNSGCQVEDWPCARMNELRWLPPISSRDPKSGCLETKQT